MTRRRALLRTIGSALGASVVGTAAAGDGRRRATAPGAGRPSDEGLAVAARGELVGRVERRGATLIHSRRFHSDDLAERYGDPTFEYEPVAIPVEHAPPGFEAGVEYRHETTRVIGSPAEQHRSELATLRASGAGAAPLGDPTDAVPLYSYATSGDARSRLTDRAAPINLAWADGPATDVRDWMQEYEWTQELQVIEEYSVDQYVNLGGDLIETTTHVMDTAWDWGLTTEQDHIRLYDLPGDPDGVAVVGQIHHDPIDHNRIGETVGPLPEGSWEFVAARGRAADLWTSYDSSYRHGEVDRAADTSTWDAGNAHDDVPSHDGDLVEIHNDGFAVVEYDCGFICEASLDRPEAVAGARPGVGPVPAPESASGGRVAPPPRLCACSLGF